MHTIEVFRYSPWQQFNKIILQSVIYISLNVKNSFVIGTYTKHT